MRRRFTRAILATLFVLAALVPAPAGAAARFAALAAHPIEDDGGLPIVFTLVDQQLATPYYNPQGVTVSGHAAATYACVYASGYAVRTEVVTDSWVQTDYYFPFGPDGVIEGELELYPPPSWMTCRDGTTLRLKQVAYFGVTAGFGLQRVGLAPVPGGPFTRTFG